jgi:hypothetical protein
MRPKPADNQNLLFSARLEQILDHNHSLFNLADAIDWPEFEEAFGSDYQKRLKNMSAEKDRIEKAFSGYNGQGKTIPFPTDAKLYQRMREKLVGKAKDYGIELRQSYVRKGKQALVVYGRYAYARWYKRARRQLRKLSTH